MDSYFPLSLVSPVHTQFRVRGEFDNCFYVDLKVLSMMALFFLKFPLHFQMFGSLESHPVTLKLIKLKLSSSILAVLSCAWNWKCSQGERHINVTLPLQFPSFKGHRPSSSACFCERVSVIQDTQPSLELEHNYFVCI